MATPWAGMSTYMGQCPYVPSNCAHICHCGIKGNAQLVKKESHTLVLCATLLSPKGVSVAMGLSSGSNLESEMQTLQRRQAVLSIADAHAADAHAVIGAQPPQGLAMITTLTDVRQKVVTARMVGKTGDTNAITAVALA